MRLMLLATQINIFSARRLVWALIETGSYSHASHRTLMPLRTDTQIDGWRAEALEALVRYTQPDIVAMMRQEIVARSCAGQHDTTLTDTRRQRGRRTAMRRSGACF